MATSPKIESDSGCFNKVCGGGEEPSSSRRKIKRRRTTALPEHAFNDAALAKEMNALSIEERERIIDEIHGVAAENEEAPEFIASCLERMDSCLAHLCHAKRKDYDRAVFQKPSIRKDKKFKLMFLRCDNYSPKKAAERMAKYFTFKRDLFGDDKLVKQITLDDLDEKDIELAKAAGEAVLLSKPDRSGRPVMFIDLTRYTFPTSTRVNRFRFHCLMRLLESETAQKKGTVMILYCPGAEFASGSRPAPSTILSSFQQIDMLAGCIPTRMTCNHFCYDNPVMKFFISLIRSGMGRHVRLQFRSHFGSPTEIRYSLRTFGILTDGIIFSRGELDQRSKLWQQYIESSREVERKVEETIAAEEARTGIISVAARNDVLLGRGRSFQEFLGNRRFLKALDSDVERYKACRHLFEKQIILNELMKNLRDTGGRFLKRGEDGWEIAEEEVAMEKIRKYFRSKPTGGSPASGHDGAGLEVDTNPLQAKS